LDGFDFDLEDDHVNQLATVLNHHVRDNCRVQVLIVVGSCHVHDVTHHDRDSPDVDLILERACFLHFDLATQLAENKSVRNFFRIRICNLLDVLYLYSYRDYFDIVQDCLLTWSGYQGWMDYAR